MLQDEKIHYNPSKGEKKKKKTTKGCLGEKTQQQ